MHSKRTDHTRRRTIALALGAGLAMVASLSPPVFADALVAVSGTGNANGELVAVSGTGDATSSGGIAISGAGIASGPTAVSGLGARRAVGNVTVRGEAVLPQFPCPRSPLQGTGTCQGTFSGDWTGSVSGTRFGSVFAARWATLLNARVTASFDYWELICLGAPETVSGEAVGGGSASAAANEVVGYWLERGETGPRAVVEVSLGFTFRWTRLANTALLDVESTTLNLEVAGLGARTVVSGPQLGVATMTLTGADNATVPSCSTPLVNARGQIAAEVPLTIVAP